MLKSMLLYNKTNKTCHEGRNLLTYLMIRSFYVIYINGNINNDFVKVIQWLTVLLIQMTYTLYVTILVFVIYVCR